MTGLVINPITGMLERDELTAAKHYADALAAAVGNAVTLKGSWDASTGTFPTTVGIKSGWSYIVGVAGVVDGTTFAVDDLLMAIADNPSSTVYVANWYRNTSPLLTGMELLVNKSTNLEADKTSNVKYPTAKAVYDWATGLFLLAADFYTTAHSWTAQQSFKEIKETDYTITDAAEFEIDPANGTMQKIVLSASRTPLATNFESGQSITLKINAGSYAITWTSILAASAWIGGAEPTLATTGHSVVVLWRDGDGMHGVYIGDMA